MLQSCCSAIVQEPLCQLHRNRELVSTLVLPCHCHNLLLFSYIAIINIDNFYVILFINNKIFLYIDVLLI